MKKTKILALTIAVITLVQLFHLTLASAYVSQNNKISPYISEKLSQQNKIKVDVYLEDPQTGNLLSNKKINQITNQFLEKTIYEEGFTAELTKNEIETLAKKPEVKYIVPSLVLVPFLQDAVPLIDADLAWQQQINDVNLTAEGETVCVIDTGVDFTQPDLTAKNIAGGNFDCTINQNCPLVVNMNLTNTHGTHVAGIVGAKGGINGIGIDSNLIGVFVFTPEGNAPALYVKRAVDFCVQKAEQYDISVITLSLGTNSVVWEDHCDSLYLPLTNSIENATAKNISVTIATGNIGSSTGISFPACVSSSIPVGATNKNDILASYSNYNDLVKLFAPGTDINSTCFWGYCRISGTSMATPMVAGAIAIINQYLKLSEKTMTPFEIEAVLQKTGDPISNLPSDFKRINVNKFIMFKRSDLNNDNQVDTADLSILLGAFGECDDYCPEDLNSDGVVDNYDVIILASYWSSPIEFNPADLNHDDAINSEDVALLLGSWGACSPEEYCTADINQDGVVDSADLAILLGSWS